MATGERRSNVEAIVSSKLQLCPQVLNLFMQRIAVLLFPLREPPLKFLFRVHSADLKFVRDAFQNFIRAGVFRFQDEHSFHLMSSIPLSVKASDDEIGSDVYRSSLS